MTSILQVVDYSEAFEDLAHVLLEDSWVLGIRPAAGEVTFDLDVVLTPNHPRYTTPDAGEQHCYRSAELTIKAQGLVLRLSGAAPATDKNGDADLGHIDAFRSTRPGPWHLEGDWGSLDVPDPEVRLLLRA